MKKGEEYAGIPGKDDDVGDAVFFHAVCASLQDCHHHRVLY
jgi:hypothetical protein